MAMDGIDAHAEIKALYDDCPYGEAEKEVFVNSTDFTNLLIETTRLWATNLELQKVQSDRVEIMNVVNRTLLTVIIIELGVLIGIVLFELVMK